MNTQGQRRDPRERKHTFGETGGARVDKTFSMSQDEQAFGVIESVIESVITSGMTVVRSHPEGITGRRRPSHKPSFLPIQTIR